MLQKCPFYAGLCYWSRHAHARGRRLPGITGRAIPGRLPGSESMLLLLKPFRRERDWSLSHRNAFRPASAFHCVTLDGCCFLFTRYWFRQRLEQNCFCANRCRIRPNLPLQMSQRGVDFMGLRLVSLLVIGGPSPGNRALCPKTIGGRIASNSSIASAAAIFSINLTC